MVKSDSNKPHAVIVSYPLQGHVIPSVELAIKLASRGFTITFINTQFIHHQITSGYGDKKSKDNTANIFADVRKSLGLDIRYTTVSDGLPLGFDRSLNHDQFMESVLHIFSAHVEEALVEIMKGDPTVNCLIADTFFVWPGKMAKKYGLVYISFWTEPALVFTLYYHLDLLRFNGHFGCIDTREDAIDYIPGVPSIDPKDMMSYLQEIDTTSVVHQIIFRAFTDVKAADIVICNTVYELEPDIISALQKKVPFLALGPLFPSNFTNSNVETSLWSESDVSHWINSKPHGSVLYVSFGSYAHVTKRDLIEIANGVALSKVNFVWVLRPDIVSSDDSDPLPDQFKKETADRGIIIPWCNQKQVLSNPGIGGFLTHCGWNSILESIWCEVPMLCFPLLTDQFTNRKLVVNDWKIGLNLCDKKPITKTLVSNKINEVMNMKSDDGIRKAVKEVKKTMDKAMTKFGSSEKNIDQIIPELEIALDKKLAAKNKNSKSSSNN
uniref:Glycosyltransferase n=1 Tax=Nemophila menziesii TaxID=79376 RepID=A0A387II24_NEMME|nr:glucosyltransferase 29 [Nemophila menziesii]